MHIAVWELMARVQTLKKVTWRKYKTNTSITINNYLKIDGHTETPFVMYCSTLYLVLSKFMQVPGTGTVCYGCGH